MEVTVSNVGDRDINGLAIKLIQDYAEKMVVVGTDPLAQVADFSGNKYFYFGKLSMGEQRTYRIMMSPLVAGNSAAIVQFAEALPGDIGSSLEDSQGNTELHATTVVLP